MNLNERSLVGAYFSIFGAAVIGLVISILFTPLLVRFLGANQYGDYAFVLSTLGLLMIFVNSGVTRGVKKFVSEEGHPPSWQSDVFGFYTRVSLILVFFICVPILLLSLVDFFGIVGDQFVLYFQLMVLILFFKQLYWFTKNSLQGMGYEKWSEPIKVFRKGSFACFALGFAYIGYGVAGVLIGYVLSLILANILTTIYLYQIVDFKSIFRRNIPLPRKRLLTFNLLSVVLLFLMESLYNFDIILLRLFTSGTETGYYKAALVVAQLMLLLPKTLQSLLLYSSSNYWSDEKYAKINSVGTFATRLTLVSSLLMVGGMTVLADDFMPLYFGSEFSAAILPIILLLPGVVGLSLARPINAIVQGSGQLRVLVYATGAAATINVVLNLLLIPRYGMIGAAVATSFGYGMMAVFSVNASRKIGFDPLGDLRIIPIGAAAGVSTIVMYATDQLIVNRYVSLTLVTMIGILVYTILIFRLGVITETEARLVTKRLPDRVALGVNRLLILIT